MSAPNSDASAPTPADAPAPLSRLAPGLVVVGVALALMWAEEIVDLLPGTSFDRWGIRPRTTRGLLGVVVAPFLHTGFPHLIGNTIPFALLGGIIALSSTRLIVQVSVVVAVVSGGGVWLFAASNSVHIGASGLVFGYITYLATRGIFARRILWILGGVIVAAVYGGSLLWGLLPNGRMSWQGHLFGAIGGVAAAWMLHGEGVTEPDTATAGAAARYRRPP